MLPTEINTMSDKVFEIVVNEHWEQIACFAYDGYRQYGRGVVEIRKTRDGDNYETMDFNILYSVCDCDDPDHNSARPVNVYDPDYEVVVRYAHENCNPRTLILKTPSGARHPQRISLLEEFIRQQPSADMIGVRQ
jgi:hypothetical protein